MNLRLLMGDCVVRISQLNEGLIQAVISDPPYGLEFMNSHGIKWDKLDWETGGGFSKGGSSRFQNSPPLPSFSHVNIANRICITCKGTERGQDRKGFHKCRCEIGNFPPRKVSISDAGVKMQVSHSIWIAEAYRALSSGGVIKAFGASRTYHRLAMAMDEVGFVDIGLEGWGYSSGMPKSQDVSKAIDRSKGLERKVIGVKRGVRGADGTGHEKAMPGKATGIRQVACDVPVTAPACAESEAWDGWGTAMKPAWEPIVTGRKP